MIYAIAQGLATTAVGAVIGLAWRSLIWPFVLELFVEPTKLPPTYAGKIDFGAGPHHGIRLDLSKLGRRISGTLRFTEGEHLGKEYIVRGRYNHGIISIIYHAKQKHSTSQGTATFQRLSDGSLLRGFFAYYSQVDDNIAPVACELRAT